MPIIVHRDLPAYQTLLREKVFVMREVRAIKQDIRPLRIGLLNLMPTKIATETQIARILSNTPLQVELILIQMESYKPKNTDGTHLSNFYCSFSDAMKIGLDGMIITGAPVETLPFEKVAYWKELEQIMHYAEENVTSTLHICWGAQAGLYYHHGINKRPLPEKRFGVFSHRVADPTCLLFRGFDDRYACPHSRHTEVPLEAIEANDHLRVLSVSDEAGVNIVSTINLNQIYVFGHMEYDADTLRSEYQRDIDKGMKIDVPNHYFVNDDPSQEVIVNWRSTAHLFYANWLNLVYQKTPYVLTP